MTPPSLLSDNSRVLNVLIILAVVFTLILLGIIVGFVIVMRREGTADRDSRRP